MKHSLITSAAASPFAHLLGFAKKPRAARAEDGDDKKDDEAARAEDGDDDDDKKEDAKRGKARSSAEDDDDKKDDDAKGSRAEDGDDDDEDEDDKKARAKKGKAKSSAEDDDETCAEEDDDDDEVAAAALAGRKAERARCRKIFSSPAAGLRPDVAAQVAFTTNLCSAEAIGIVEAAASGGAAPKASRLHERMARVVTPSLGADLPDESTKPTGAKAAAASIVASMKKAQGAKA